MSITPKLLKIQAAPLDIVALIGMIFDVTFEVTDQLGALIDISNYSFDLQMRRSIDEPVLLEVSTVGGQITTGNADPNPGLGRLRIYIDSPTSATLDPFIGGYDLVAWDNDLPDEKIAIFSGAISWQKTFTR